MIFVLFETISGRPTQATTSASGQISYDPATQSVHAFSPPVGVSQAMSFFKDSEGLIQVKQAPGFSATQSQIVADLIDYTEINSLPPHTIVTVRLNGSVVFNETIQDGQFILETDQPGTYQIEIDSVQHLKQVIEIEAIASN